MSLINHDTGAWEENTGFELIPAGDYKAVITNSEMKPTKKGDGEMLVLELQVIEGKFENRKLWDRLNLKNPSEMAVKISRGTLSSIVKACGKTQVADSMELHNIPLAIKVGVEGEYNKIASYKAAGAAAPTLSQAGPPPKSAPWAKK